jgi:hypothetical protein
MRGKRRPEMARGNAQKKQLLAVLAGFIVVLLGTGLASADVHGALVNAIVQANDLPAAPAEAEVDEIDEVAAGDVTVVGALEADHAVAVEDEAKLEEGPEEVSEETDDPDPDAAAEDQTAEAVQPSAPVPDDDTDTDDGKTSIPLPGGGDDTDEAEDTDTADDDADETQEGDDEGADDDD